MSRETSRVAGDGVDPILPGAFLDLLQAELDPDTVRFELDILDDTWLHVTSGPDRGAKALIRAVDSGLIVHVLAPSGDRAGTVFVDSPDPSALRAAGDDLVTLLLPLGGNTTRRERAASGAGELLLRGPVGLVRAAQDALLSTGSWALVAEGQDGLNSYAELAPVEGGPTAAAALAGGPQGPSAGVMAL